MTGGQIAALIFALLLLLPGGCFLFFGIGMIGESHMGDVGGLMLVVGIVILAVMGLLFWLAFRKRPPPSGTGPTSA
jgi:membrane protein implicated in regulation of membrane protease activity